MEPILLIVDDISELGLNFESWFVVCSNAIKSSSNVESKLSEVDTISGLDVSKEAMLPCLVVCSNAGETENDWNKN